MYGRYTSEQLKKIAMGTMFLDHAAVAVIYNYGLDEMSPLLENIGLAMRLIGRMAFPLYAFLLVQGFLYTKSWEKYAARVALFAVISEIPYNLVAGKQLLFPEAQNTLVVLLIGLICMKLLEMVEQKFGLQTGVSRQGTESLAGETDTGRKFLGAALMILVVATAAVAAELLRGDYGAFGVLLILVFYLFRFRPMEQMGFGSMVLLLIYNFSLHALFAWIAIFFINRYNGERGRKLGYLPYVFYPVHLLVVYFVGVFVAANTYVACL